MSINNKSIKGNLYQLQRENVQLELKSMEGASSSTRLTAYQDAIAGYDKKIEKYDKEKAEIELKAHELEARRDDAQKHGQPFGMAIILLQIAILISSISALIKKKILWYLALPVGLVGMIFFADGFLLFIPVF